MSCGCNQSSYSSYGGCCIPTCSNSCTELCSAAYVGSSFNIPAIGQSATIQIKGLKALIIGGYLWNPTYGYLRVTSFNAVTSAVVVVNDGNPGNPTPGTIVPACTPFSMVDTPSSLTEWESYTPTLTPVAGITFNAGPTFVNTIYTAKPITLNGTTQLSEVDFILQIQFGLAGSSGTGMQISAPIDFGQSFPSILIGDANYFDGSTTVDLQISRYNSTNNFYIPASLVAASGQELQAIGKYIGVAL